MIATHEETLNVFIPEDVTNFLKTNQTLFLSVNQSEVEPKASVSEKTFYTSVT
jgi:hypothetical protein